jgi:hypothetical protein
MNKSKKPPFSSNFIAEIFPDHLNEDEKCVLALYIEYLLLGVTKELSKIFSTEVGLIDKEILPYITKRKLYLSDDDDQSWELNEAALKLLGQVKSGLKGALFKYHACAFISSTLQSRKYNIDKFNQYKLLVLLCATRLTKMGEHNSAIHSLLSEIRLLSTGNRDKLLPHLPEPNINELKTLLDELNKNRSSEYIEKNIQDLLSYYYRPFNNAYEFNRGREHKRKSGERTLTTIIVSPKTTEDEDDEGYVVHRLKTKVKESKARDYWNTEEENNTPEKVQAFAVIKSTSSDPIEHTRRSMKAKNIVDRLSMRNQSLSCDYKILTAYEITILLTCILDDLTNKSYTFNTAHTLVFCVLFGRSITEVEGMQKQRKTRFIYDKKVGCWKIKIKHTVSTFKQEEFVKNLITPVSDNVEYYLPEQLSLLLKNELPVASQEDTQKYLTAINKKFNTRLSISRVASYFMDFCKDKNIDPVLIEVISQTTSRQDSAIPYTHITQQQINTTLNLFVVHLNKLIQVKHHDLLAPNTTLNLNEGNSVGSPLMLKNSKIIKANQQHIYHLQELSSSMYFDIGSLHNQLVFYIYKMLTLASGYRAVSGAGGKFSDINFISKEYWISDKENRDRESARIIVLPDMVIQQLEEYQKHLAHLKFKVKYSAINIANRIDAVLDNTSHFLFLISSGNEVEDVSPNTIKTYMDEKFPVQLNWNRHYIRSKLMALNISPPVIYHFMGHDDIGSEGMGRYSGLSYYDFKALSVVINSILEGLSFEVVKGL